MDLKLDSASIGSLKESTLYPSSSRPILKTEVLSGSLSTSNIFVISCFVHMFIAPIITIAVLPRQLSSRLNIHLFIGLYIYSLFSLILLSIASISVNLYLKHFVSSSYKPRLSFLVFVTYLRMSQLRVLN